MTAWIRSNICKEPTIRRLLPSLVKITWPRVCWGRRGAGLCVGGDEGEPWERV